MFRRLLWNLDRLVRVTWRLIPGAYSIGKFPRPMPFGGMGKPLDEDGFSDYIPIGMEVMEAD